jgi:hypothetical protein
MTLAATDVALRAAEKFFHERIPLTRAMGLRVGDQIADRAEAGEEREHDDGDPAGGRRLRAGTGSGTGLGGVHEGLGTPDQGASGV